MRWEVAGRFKREGTYIYIYTYLRLIHVDVLQKPTQYHKAFILQLNINKLKIVIIIQGGPPIPLTQSFQW